MWLIKKHRPVNVVHQLLLIDLHHPDMIPVNFRSGFARLIATR
jgi:hypothetical protein